MPLENAHAQANPVRVRWPQRILRYFLGYDFFISYRWEDGRKYALALAEALRETKYTCFLDSSDFRVGDLWTEAGKDALRRTSVLIRVGTPGALVSDPVLKEVEAFRKLERPIFPIDIGRSLSEA